MKKSFIKLTFSILALFLWSENAEAAQLKSMTPAFYSSQPTGITVPHSAGLRPVSGTMNVSADYVTLGSKSGSFGTMISYSIDGAAAVLLWSGTPAPLAGDFAFSGTIPVLSPGAHTIKLSAIFIIQEFGTGIIYTIGSEWIPIWNFTVGPIIPSYTVSTSVGANGTVSPTSRSVSSGSTTTFTITPNPGYTATASGCGGSLSGTTYTTGAIAATCTVTVTFTSSSYTVSTSVGANGTVSPTSRSVSSGSTATFTVTPSAGYTATASGCGGSLSGTTYTTGAITAACTVTATFTATISAPVVSLFIDGLASNKTLATPTSSFTFQATGTNSPTACYMQKLIASVGVWSAWSEYTCSAYTSATTVTTSTFGFDEGINAIRIYMRNAGGPSPTRQLAVTVPAPIACILGAVSAWGSCNSSATCTQPPSQLTGQSGTQIGVCPSPTYTGTVLRTCSTAVVTCTPPLTVCGNGNCETGETFKTCPSDCKMKFRMF